MNEKAVVKKIQEWFKERGGVCHKVHGGPMSSGFPDLIGCIDGQTWLIEAKVPNAKPRVPKATREKLPTEMQKWMEVGATIMQAKTLYDWMMAGAVCMVATSVKDVEDRYYNEKEDN
jgi:hypothetical protein